MFFCVFVLAACFLTQHTFIFQALLMTRKENKASHQKQNKGKRDVPNTNQMQIATQSFMRINPRTHRSNPTNGPSALPSMQSTTQSHANCNKELQDYHFEIKKGKLHTFATALHMMQSRTQSHANCTTKAQRSSFQEEKESMPPMGICMAHVPTQTTTHANWNNKAQRSSFQEEKESMPPMGICIAHDAIHNTNPMQSATQSFMRINPRTHRSNPTNGPSAWPSMQSTTQSHANCNTKLQKKQCKGTQIQPKPWALS